MTSGVRGTCKDGVPETSSTRERGITKKRGVGGQISEVRVEVTGEEALRKD